MLVILVTFYYIHKYRHISIGEVYARIEEKENYGNQLVLRNLGVEDNRIM